MHSGVLVLMAANDDEWLVCSGWWLLSRSGRYPALRMHRVVWLSVSLAGRSFDRSCALLFIALSVCCCTWQQLWRGYRAWYSGTSMYLLW